MKKFILLFVFASSIWLVGAQDLFVVIEKSFQQGDWEPTRKICTESLVICFNEVEKTYTNQKGMEAIIAYLDGMDKASFAWKHKGSSKEGSKFGIGTYKHGSKEVTCYFYLKSNPKGQLAIREIRFEKP